MKSWNIKHPIIAFIVIFILAAIMSNYGVVQGSLLVFDFLAGIIIYKTFTS